MTAWRRRGIGLALAAALLAGCAAPPPRSPADTATSGWSGRLALTVHGEPPQRASAGFELRGAPQRGELLLSTPLGQLAARVRWDDGGAWLERPDAEPQRYADVAALTEALTGAALPLPALFDWLDGRPANVPGWTLLQLDAAQGRLHARRDAPAPVVELRLAWQRP
ncbi:outer membrane lipoprotein LolB [Tepidimonas alkaliphilus]|uniref:outer membrane lipoprotein LolB n=1 Tax=Tepidimonas alkaliphilus TaxID=2588942 RepID=UPI001FE396B1|nr:outer membrane lipoprotein LolB [Tepidimonas alkaliphilus]